MKSRLFIPVYLSRGLVALIDGEDEDRVMEFKWSAVEHTGKFYAAKRYRNDERATYLHRFVIKAPETRQVRFLNGFTLDCRRDDKGDRRIYWKRYVL